MPTTTACPMTRKQIIDRYFMEHRAKLLDIAAFLDRVERAQDAASTEDDHRMYALRCAIELLIDDKPERTRRILELLSDPTDLPISIATPGPATGAPLRTGNPGLPPGATAQ